MSSEQKHNISFVQFFFIINIYDMPCERALISALSQPIKAPQNLRHYGKLNSGLQKVSINHSGNNGQNTGNRNGKAAHCPLYLAEFHRFCSSYSM